MVVDTKHNDLIKSSVDDYAPRFLPDYVVVYTDMGDGDRITEEEENALSAIGISLTISDAMPDVLLIDKASNSLWVIEAVTSDGEVDLHKVAQLTSLSERCGFSSIGFTTTYRTWRELATRQHKTKNIHPGTYIWVQEDGSKQFKAETY